MTGRFLLGASAAAALVFAAALVWRFAAAPQPATATAMRPAPAKAGGLVGPDQASPALGAPQSTHTGRTQASASPPPAQVQAAAARGAAPSPAFDLLVHQRAVQAALSSDTPGLAGSAARAIQTCQRVLATEDRVRAALDARQRQQPDPRLNAAAERIAQGVRACQALDPQAAQHLEPLLRRSLAEGDLGSADSLRRLLKDSFDPTGEPALVQALRRDALACHLGSAQALLRDRHRWPQLLSPTEQQVLQQVVATRTPRRDQDALDSLVQQLPAEARARLNATQQPAGPVDSAAAQALLAQIQARCEAAGAQRP